MRVGGAPASVRVDPCTGASRSPRRPASRGAPVAARPPVRAGAQSRAPVRPASATPLPPRRWSVSMPYLVFAGVLWGTGGLFGRLLAERTGLSALAVAGYRLAVGGALLLVPLLLSGRRPRGRVAWRRIGAVAGLAALFQASYFTAVSLTGVGLATLVTIGSAPVIVLLVERSGGRAMVRTVGLALVGIVALVGLPGDGLDAGQALLGALFAVVSGAGFAAVTLLASKPVPGVDASLITGPAFALGGLALLVPAAAGPGVGFAPDPGSFAILAAFAV